jgi:hypothetical protein
MNWIPSRGWLLPIAILLAFLLPAPTRAAEGDLKLQAKLVWGANEPPKEPAREVDAETARKLKSIFKWERYYEMSATNFVSSVRVQKRLILRNETSVTVQNLGNSQIEVELFNKGKRLVRKKQPISPGELLVVAGDDTNNTAWFVVFKRE